MTTDVTSELLGSAEPVAEEPAPGDLGPELEHLDPQPGKVRLSNGIEVDVRPLRAREAFALMRIVTHGAAGLLPSLNLNSDPADIVGQMAGLLIYAVPEAPEESIQFIRQMVVLPDIGEVDRSGQPVTIEGKQSQQLRDAVNEVLSDPEIADVVEIVTAVFTREADDLTALGKRLRSLLELGKKTGNL